eukprot:gene3081-3545_t
MDQYRMMLLLAISCSSISPLFVESNEQCIAGKYHKKSPGAETLSYPECAPWKEKTCCTSEFVKELKANQTRTLYNHDWHLCKKLSAECERFWINQECFYQCSPYVYKWKQPSANPSFDILKGVPICASVCDRWFQACKTDQICVENVLTDYNFTEHGGNSCPKNKPCMTYENMYGSGKKLCEKMWGTSFIYTKENADSSNCMVMWFAGQNPNSRVSKLKVPKLKVPSGSRSHYDFAMKIVLYFQIIFMVFTTAYLL